MFEPNEEMESLLATPIAELNTEQIRAASAYKLARTEHANSQFVPPANNRPFNIIGDSIAPFQSMVDGRLYDSKSQYYEHLKRSNTRIVENGEMPTPSSRTTKGDYNNRKELREAVERHYRER